MDQPDFIASVEPVTRALQELGIQYYICGSVASSAYGTARSTLNVDIVADFSPHQAAGFIQKLSHAYYIDSNSVHDAISRRSSFNIIHLESMVKVDIFISQEGPYQQEALRRKIKETLKKDTEPIYLCSAEDVILGKLQWYKEGGKTSQKQWQDILGIVIIQEKNLDYEYLRHWAVHLGVCDLLDEALKESGQYRDE